MPPEGGAHCSPLGVGAALAVPGCPPLSVPGCPLSSLLALAVGSSSMLPAHWSANAEAAQPVVAMATMSAVPGASRLWVVGGGWTQRVERWGL